MSTKSTKVAEVFTRTRDYIRRFVVLPDDDLDIITTWTITTWTFSPMCTTPATMPYLYVTGAKGSGKTVLGQDVMGTVCRNHTPTVGITGPGVFRIIGDWDPETGEVVNNAPTLALDEIDATFSGAKDEPLRQMLNAGYRRGATVPRVAGKVTINFPVHCPKILMGIDNGHLPDTVTDRSIRIDLRKATPEQMKGIEPFYIFDVEEEADELSSQLAEWAKQNSMVLRDYRPEPIPDLSPRQWEIARTLVQIAHAVGNEARIREALHTVMTRNPERPDGKVGLYRAIFNLLASMDGEHADRVTSRQILAQLDLEGVNVPGQSGKGLASVLSEDGIAPDYIRLRPGHPGIIDGQPVQRGYFRHKFDGVFVRYLDDEE
jgi:hypothetical protein